MSARLDSAPAASARGEVVVGRDASGDSVRALLEEADRRDARAAVLVRAGADDGERRAALLSGPVIDSGFDWVGAAYRRQKLEGMLNTGIVSPLLRALFGKRLRQPCSGEAALSIGLVRALLDDSESRASAYAGSEAWMVSAALAGRWRVAQAWLGEWTGPRGPAEDPSHSLARAVAPVFGEMARYAERWHRREGSEAVPSFGQAGIDEGAPPVNVGALEDVFRLGVRELGALWAQVLPPTTLLALRHAAAAERAHVADGTWARIVYDFALAFSLRTVERQQLLRSMTPIYLGWVAGFARDACSLDAEGSDTRVESLCEAFEREKPYAIARWRWPDGFVP